MQRALKTAADRLYAVLVAAQKERDQRPDLLDGPDGPECEWARFERNAMWREVNRIRGERGLKPVLLSSIVSAEQQAVGHCDYTSKLAVYCAEITEK
ncbi:hypothetical protein ACH4VR_29610 [Streptomyces sp. NPDC020883]|uniref:hypothetical protein n=1 Tax=Streptomyces sp. NPDC020883 TaxID=3365099 RepID=UPI003796A586